MKDKLFFFDFEFTGLNPDCQPISLGIVSDCGKSIYCEFTDFDIERCDDWVKTNVVGKLKYYGTPEQGKMFLNSYVDGGTYWGSQNTTEIKEALHRWLDQFCGYNIQFIADCSTWDWWFLVQLLAEWDITEDVVVGCPTCDDSIGTWHPKIGLTKLPETFRPFLST